MNYSEIKNIYEFLKIHSNVSINVSMDILVVSISAVFEKKICIANSQFKQVIKSRTIFFIGLK